MANLNPVEASIVNIRNIVPSIVLTFHNCMRKYLPEILDQISNILTNDIKLQTYLKYKAPNSIREFYKDGEIEFSYLSCVDPLNLVKAFTYSESANQNTVEGTETNVFTLFFKDFFNTLKLNNDSYSDLKNERNERVGFNDEPFITSIRSPYLAEINLCEMGSVGTRALFFDFNVPRMGVKTVTNYKITEFMQQKENMDVFTDPGQDPNHIVLSRSSNYVSRRKVSEILVGQIDYQTLGLRIMKIYKEIYEKVISNEEFLGIIKNIDIFTDEHSYEHFEKLNKNFYWTTFVLLSKLLNSDKVAKETEYETNTEDVLPKGESELISHIKVLLDDKLNTLINDCAISMSLTFLAKVGRTDIAYPYDINKDMLNGIMDVTLEDINYFNTKFDNIKTLDKESEIYNYLNPLNRKKSGSIVRKRMLDYVMLSWLAQKEYDVNFGGFNYLSHLYDKNGDYNEFRGYKECCPDHKGSILYKFAVRNLQEIYSNMTYTANFTHNIVDMRNGKYIYKATIDLARAGIDLYIVDTDIKIFLNLGCSERDKTELLISNANYDTNTLKNHRALASIYKAAVHVLFKLIYVLEGIKKYSEFTKMNDIPTEHAERYVKVKAQLREIGDVLRNFKSWGSSHVLNPEQGYLASVADKIFPGIEYSLGAFIGGKITSVNKMTDEFTDKNDPSISTNDILAVLHTFDKLNTDKVISLNDDHKVFYMTRFDNIASVYAGTNSEYIEEICKEFDADEDIVKSLDNFGTIDNPELRATHRRLYESYENLRNGFDFEIKSQLFAVESYDLLDKSIEYLNSKDRTLEGLALTSSIVSYANDIFNVDSEKRSAEDIAKFNNKIQEFDDKLLKSIEKIQEEEY